MFSIGNSMTNFKVSLCSYLFDFFQDTLMFLQIKILREQATFEIFQIGHEHQKLCGFSRERFDLS
jgi:hypothetical protein